MNMNKQTGREGRAPASLQQSSSTTAAAAAAATPAAPTTSNAKPTLTSSTHGQSTRSRSKSGGRTSVASSSTTTRVVNELTQTEDSLLQQSQSLAQSQMVSSLDPNSRAAVFQASFLYDPQATPASSIPPPAVALHQPIHSAAANQATNEHMNVSMLNSSAVAPSVSRAAPTSTDSSFVLPGSARISDLNPTDKSKIGKLLQEIVILKKEGIEAQAKKKELEQNVELLEIKNSLTLKEAHQLKAEYEASLDLIKSYQIKLNEVHESPELKFAIQQREERAKQVQQQSLSSSHQSPSISKLHQLNERAKAAANVSAAVSAAASLNASYVDPIITAATITANSMPPFSSVIHSLSSSPYRPLPIPSTSAMPGFSLPSTGYNTDEEMPRSAAPRPSAQPSPHHVHTDDRISNHYALGVQEIERAYASNLNEAQHSLSPRRRLDLEHAMNASPNRHYPEQSQYHDRSFLHRSRTPSPSPPTAAIIHTKSAVVNPRDVALIPHAVSGVTRAMASSSPDQIEKRARQLAQDMYDRKIEEDRRAAMQTTVNEAYVHSHSQMKPYHAYNPSQSQQRSRPQLSQSSFYPSTKSEEEEKRAVESQHRVSSLSAFLNAHPLTSTLSPMVKVKPKQQHAGSTESSPSKPRSAKKKKSHRTPEKELSILRELSAASVAADGPSEYASSILNRSMRLAERFAQEKRAREHTLNSNPSASTSNSSNSSRGPVQVIDSEVDEEEEKSRPTGILESPFSSLALSQSQVAQMTPTSRRIHRLLGIQNPQLVQQQQEEQAALERDRLARQKEKERLAEMHEKRRKDLEGAEMRTKQAQERAQAVAAALSKMPPKLTTIIDSPIQPEAPADEDPDDEFNQPDAASSTPKPIDRIVITTPSGSHVPSHGQSRSSSSKPPAHPTARSKTPVETYVPPPFSFRPKSRSNQSQQEDRDQQLNASLSSPAPTSNSRAATSAHSTPASQALSTPQDHENMHQSFTSPFPTGRLAATPGTAGSDLNSEYLQEDAEMWDLFHLRSPSSLQQVQQAQMIEREMQDELAARRRNAPTEQHPRSKQQHIQDRYTRNFANDMLEASGLSPEGITRRSVPEVDNSFLSSANTASYYRTAAPFEYSSAYPTSRSNMPLATATSTPSSAQSKTVNASPSKSEDLQARLDSLRLKQLEEELEDVMPQVLQGLVQHSKHKQPPPSNAQIQLPMIDAGFSPRLSQPSSPIALISHKKRTVKLSPQASASQNREEKDDDAQNRSQSSLNLSQRYKAHVDAYALRRQQLQQRSPAKSRGARRFTTEADASSMMSSDFDGEHETSLLDIIDQMQEDEQ